MSSICPNNNGPLCTTCTLAGLIRCPIMGVPLPLVEGERPKVEQKRRVYPELPEALKAWKYINDRRTD